MESKNSFKGASFLLAAGAVIGAWVTSKWFERRNVNGDVIVQNVRKLFQVVGTIEGSWIEMGPVFVDSPEFYGEVYYGGVTRKEDNELVQYEFYADAKTGAVIDLYKIG